MRTRGEYSDENTTNSTSRILRNFPVQSHSLSLAAFQVGSSSFSLKNSIFVIYNGRDELRVLFIIRKIRFCTFGGCEKCSEKWKMEPLVNIKDPSRIYILQRLECQLRRMIVIQRQLSEINKVVMPRCEILARASRLTKSKLARLTYRCFSFRLWGGSNNILCKSL